jgi:hypothetical protein
MGVKLGVSVAAYAIVPILALKPGTGIRGSCKTAAFLPNPFSSASVFCSPLAPIFATSPLTAQNESCRPVAARP